MPTYCSSCGDRLYGDEADEGTCTKCRTNVRTANAPPRRTEEDPARAYHPDEPRGAPWQDDRSPRGGWDDEPSPYDQDNGADNEWRSFRNGVRCVRTALIIQLVALLIGFVVTFLAAASRTFEMMIVGQVVQGVGSLTACVVWFIGLALLCSVPTWTGLRALAVTSLCGFSMFFLSVLGLVLLTVAQITGPGGRLRPGTLAAAGLSWQMVLLILGGSLLLLLIGHVCQLLLFSGAARRLGDQPLAGQFITYMILSILLPVVFYGVMFLAMGFALGGMGRGAFGPLFGLGGFGCGVVVMIGLFVWLLSMLAGLIRRCDRPNYGDSRYDY
jgi:hypothetical protein